MIFGDKMCSGTLHRPINGMVDHFSFSALNLLRTYNRLVTPTGEILYSDKLINYLYNQIVLNIPIFLQY